MSRLLLGVLLSGLAAPAAAQDEADAGVPAIPDSTLEVMKNAEVIFELDDGVLIHGRLAGFDAEWLTVIRADAGEVVPVPRSKLVRLRALDEEEITFRAREREHERRRLVGVHFGISVSLSLDLHWKLFYAFGSGNVLFPLTTLAGTSPWLSFSVGGGIALPLAKGTRWYGDVFALMLPLHVGGSYSYLGMGVGAGLRYAGNSGFTFAIKVPIFGYAVRAGRSPYGYDPPYRAAYGFGYYFLAGIMGLPLISVGYRF